MTDKKNGINRLLFIVLTVALFFCIDCHFMNDRIIRAAEETEKTEEEIINEIKTHRDSIVRIESVCWDGDEVSYRTKSFSGFVVTADATGIYVVTVHNNLSYTSEEKENIRTEYGLENNARISEKIEVVFNGDLRVEASIVGESDQRNLTVLKLDQTIHFENVFQFAEKNASDNERLYLLSYPETAGQGGAVYNAENVQITAGTLLNLYRTEEIIFLWHDIQTDSASVGGPLLNQEGLVVGVLLTSAEDGKGAAISCEAVKAFLDTFNVSYLEYEVTAAEARLPLLNIILGAVIVILLIAVILQAVRGRRSQEKETDGRSVRQEKKTPAEAAGNMTDRSTGRAVNKTDKKANKKRERAGGGAEKTGNIKPAAPGSDMNASLEYPSEKRLVLIRKTAFIIGRTKDADFIIGESKGVSRKHARIQFDGKGFYLEDLHSTNHTFLNGLELAPGEKRQLKDGDEIAVGKETLVFHSR